MDQHPVPRQITSFEFKLIGFMTIRQFIYLVIFIPLGYIIYKIFPIVFLNIIFGFLTGFLGVFFAFIPINDRPLDVWLKNLYKRITSPTQYTYKKNNEPIFCLQDLFFISDPHRALVHVESQDKLTSYLAKKNKGEKTKDDKQKTPPFLIKQNNIKKKPTEFTKKDASTSLNHPFFAGIIKNHKLIPLPGILVYVKDEKTGRTVRLLKTNPHGVFATFSRLPAAEYVFEFKDPRGVYFFDTMKLNISDYNQKPLEFFSKELI